METEIIASVKLRFDYSQKGQGSFGCFISSQTKQTKDNSALIETKVLYPSTLFPHTDTHTFLYQGAV